MQLFFSGKDADSVGVVGWDLADVIRDNRAYNTASGNNYGLLFTMAGYDGGLQSSLADDYRYHYGVDVF